MRTASLIGNTITFCTITSVSAGRYTDDYPSKPIEMARPLYVSAYAHTPDAQTIDLCSIVRMCPAYEQDRWISLQALLENAASADIEQIHVEPDHDCWRLRLRGPFSFDESRLDQAHIYRDCLSLLSTYMWGDPVQNQTRRGWFGFTLASVPRLLQLDVVPSSRGQTYMITVLHAFKAPAPNLDKLALNRSQQKQLRALLQHNNGLILLASEMTQGRAQTARALAQEMVSPDRKVVCADMPGHPLLPRTSQLAMDSPATAEQHKAWSAMCRMGADAIVACQSMDDELAGKLAQFAAENTLVIQGVGVTSVTDAIDRLLGMGVRPESLARIVRAVVIQRHVRCLCTYCRTPKAPDDAGTAWLARYSPIKSNNINDWLRHRMHASFSDAVGCDRCEQTGYGTSREVFDIVTLSEEVVDSLYDADIRYAKTLLQKHHDAMAEQMLRLAQEGIITIAEAARIQPA